LRGDSDSAAGVFSESGIWRPMALSDTAIKKARATEKAYSMSDDEGLYLWVTPMESLTGM
jgi:hypothetical protein